MGMFSRDITAIYNGHEIELSIACIGHKCQTDQFKLYIDGKLVDQHAISGFTYLFGVTVTLRGQLALHGRNAETVAVKAIIQLRAVGGHRYSILAKGKEICQERGSWWGGW